MTQQHLRTLFTLIILLLATACGESADTLDVMQEAAADVAAEPPVIEDTAMEEVEEAMEEPADMELADVADDSAETETQSSRTTDSQRGGQRLIIKNADMSLNVVDTDQTVSTVADIITSKGGYIVNQNVYSGDQGFRYATMQIGVPVDQFEATLEAFRQLGMVLREEATGVDVTEEFVDLRSKLDNLLATQERLRGFLTDATTVEQALEVDKELRKIEEELNVVQGRVNYLQDRAAFSTINLQINPILPTATPTPTPTATPIPTATPLPTPDDWRPQDTVQAATTRLQNTSTSVADAVIYTSIVCGPWVLLFSVPALVGFAIYRRVQRRRAGTSLVEEAAVGDSAENEDSAE